MSLVIIGKIYDISGDPENPTVTELEGFHVNSTHLLKGMDEYLVTPKHPKQVIMGVKTFFYKFSSEKQARVLLSEYFIDMEEEEG